jgi:hypothetical protein
LVQQRDTSAQDFAFGAKFVKAKSINIAVQQVKNNQVVMQHVGNEDAPTEMLKRNSYTLLNVSPRFF